MKKLLLSTFAALAVLGSSFQLKAGGDGPSWSTKYEHPKSLTENKGQFYLPGGSADKVEFAYDNSSTRIYFTKHGLTYSFLKVWQKEEEEGEKEKDTKKEHFQSEGKDVNENFIRGFE